MLGQVSTFAIDALGRDRWLQAGGKIAEELERLSGFKPIREDDVLDAHHFFQNLGADWASLIPEEVRERCTAIDTEPDPDEAS